jgi:phage terminase Nu1 subunit (DNA packaging protein)
MPKGTPKGEKRLENDEFLAALPEIVTGAQMSVILGVNRRTMLDLAARGILVRTHRGQYRLMDSLHRYHHHLRDKATGRANTPTGKSLTDERAELTAVQKQREQLAFDKEMRTVLTFVEVKDGWTKFAGKTKSTILGLTSRIRFELPHLTSHDGEKIAAVCREALEEIADEISGAGDIPGADKRDLDPDVA